MKEEMLKCGCAGHKRNIKTFILTFLEREPFRRGVGVRLFLLTV